MAIEFSNEQLQKIKYAVIAAASRRDRHITADAVDEIFGDVMVVLVRLALPRFDPARGDLDPFLRECATRETYTILRNRRRPLVRPVAATVSLPCGRIAPDGFDAGPIADEMFANPERYFTPSERETLRIIRTATPCESNLSMAARAGCHPVSFSMRKNRLKRAILAVAEKHFSM